MKKQTHELKTQKDICYAVFDIGASIVQKEKDLQFESASSTFSLSLQLIEEITPLFQQEMT